MKIRRQDEGFRVEPVHHCISFWLTLCVIFLMVVGKVAVQVIPISIIPVEFGARILKSAWD